MLGVGVVLVPHHESGAMAIDVEGDLQKLLLCEKSIPTGLLELCLSESK